MTEKTANVTDLFVPWLETAPEYNTSILDKAWAQPDYGRMMLNENPVPPSDKVVNAVTEIVKKGNRYPDSMLRLRTKIGALHGVVHFSDLDTSRFHLVPGGAALAQANGDINAGIAQVLGMGMALGAIADDGHFLAANDGEISVFVVINLHVVHLMSRLVTGIVSIRLKSPLLKERGKLKYSIPFHREQYRKPPCAPPPEWRFRSGPG